MEIRLNALRVTSLVLTCEYDLKELVVAHIEVADLLRAVIVFA